MELTREKALELHRKMWTDMRKELGNNPTSSQRQDFKRKWCSANFPKEIIVHNCFLCAYVKKNPRSNDACVDCPINWNSLKRYDYDVNRCYASYKGDNPDEIYLAAPITSILNLPEKR
jgi:hypothetical protein